MSTAADLPAWLASQRKAVDGALIRILERHPALHPDLDDAIRHALLLGGKRLRPTLALAACDLAGGSADAGLMAGAAVELVHTYSLIHDDLPAMDDDDLRRGQPTIHVRWDEATAVLAGDALLTLAFEVLARAPEFDPIPADIRLDMVASLSSAAGQQGMVGGQALDMAASAPQLQPRPPGMDVEGLAAIHRAKTGALIRASVRLGVLAAGNRDEALALALDNYAGALGLAFQVVDDILDATGDTATLGKPAGSDQALGKLTYVSLLGLDGARAEAARLCRDAESALNPIAGAHRLQQLVSWVRDRSH